jgi:uncharacterized protein (UPF0276 family)
VAAPWTVACPSGLLWRPALSRFVPDEVKRGRLGFVEVIAESVGSTLAPGLAAVRAAGGVVVPHGVSLGLGGADRPAGRRLDRLAAVAELCDAPLVSEHLAFVRARGREAGHLLPVPRTREALAVVVENIRDAAAHLPVRLALEPIAALVEWPRPELTEVDFLTAILDRVDVDLVLDVANMHVNAANRRRAGWSGPDTDPCAFIERLPLDRVAYVHAAGGRVVDGRHHDTHADPLWPEVEGLVEEVWAHHEVPGLLLERDTHIPEASELRGEVARLAAAVARGRARRHAAITPARPARSVKVEPAVGSTAPRRHRLARAQAAFLRAVSGGGEVPPGFDRDDLGAVAAILAARRASAVARLAPDVAALPAFTRGFRRWARTHPLTERGAAGDAARFVRSLPARERTAYACRAAVLHGLGLGLGHDRGGRPHPGPSRRDRWRSPVRMRMYTATTCIVVGVRAWRWSTVREISGFGGSSG